LLVLGLALAATSCGSGGKTTIRIGFYGDCYGPWGYTQNVAGAELPFVRRGAHLLGGSPSDGVSAITIAGKRVELVVDCDFYGSTKTELSALRRLVEQQHAAVVVTQNYVPDFGEDFYPPHQPGVAFVSTGLLPAPSRPNLFRVASNFRQALAGLGTFAYKTLGWRTAATLGEDDFIGYGAAAGFDAEFCSLGGKIVKRLWVQPQATSWAPAVRRIPPGTDGVLFAPNFLATASFFTAYRKLHRDVGRRVVMAGTALARGDRTVGVTSAGFLPFVWGAPEWNRYLRDFKAAFPDYQGRRGDPADVYAYDAVELTLQAIAASHGDVSHGERHLMAAMRQSHIQTPVGALALDRTQNAVMPNFLLRVRKTAAGKAVVGTVRVLPNVENTFGGYFTPSSPPDSEMQPMCRKGHVPRWAR
jgi:branched-chain amino acid transport system substrate-binding protein